MYAEIPVLPVVVPLGILVAAALIWRLRRRNRLSAPRVAVAMALGVYAAGIVANTIFPIYRDKPHRHAAWDVYLTPVPFTSYDVVDAATNIVVFVPLGILVSLLMSQRSWWRPVAVTAACSAAIETSQFLTGNLLGGGHLADVNDLVFNVVGGAVGVALLASLSHVPGASRLIDPFRWRAAAPDAVA